jgi:hypothetical protein
MDVCLYILSCAAKGLEMGPSSIQGVQQETNVLFFRFHSEYEEGMGPICKSQIRMLKVR